ncbi:MAG: hypothetical protein ABJO01_08170 [Parasphingorhabdus sp.]|uniref:hypothetical protein n=1 Tax=Parasphingorhabdus sp. TaxID=2709688 RepID=UPI0032997939
MSNLASVEQPKDHSDPFAESFARLQAVESVVGLVADMAGTKGSTGFALKDVAAIETAYRSSFPMTRKRFDRGCDDLAIMAQSGAKALLHLNSAGRSQIDIAAQRLMREIQMSGQQTLRLLQK